MKKRLTITGLMVLLLTLFAFPHVAGADGDTIYVDADAPGPTHDGTSWNDAYLDLQSALTAVESGDEIWVAEGTYKPSVEVGGIGPRYATFQMKNGVGIYGGFDPTVGDDMWEERDWENNTTILSGDIGIGESSDNCYHVFYHMSLNLDRRRPEVLILTYFRTSSCTASRHSRRDIRHWQAIQASSNYYM